MMCAFVRVGSSRTSASVNCRGITESFSAAIGMGIFFGRTELSEMAINPFRPATNRVGKDAYKDSSEHFLSSVRRRDEIWMRLRWTF